MSDFSSRKIRNFNHLVEIFTHHGGSSLNSIESKVLSLNHGEENSSKEEFLPDGKEDQTLIFEEICDETGFPKIFSIKTQEVSMFLRVVHFFTCRMVWEPRSRKSGPLELLLGLQFLEWFDNLSVSSNLLTKELHLVFTIWNSIFESKELYSDDGHFLSEMSSLQQLINENQDSFGHLTFRHFQSEKRRDTFLNYIFNHLVSYREIQRKNLNHTSHFKRSSDHSNSTRGNTSFGRIPTPRVKDLEPSDLLEFLDLTPHERKLQLLRGEDPEFS